MMYIPMSGTNKRDITDMDRMGSAPVVSHFPGPVYKERPSNLGFRTLDPQNRPTCVINQTYDVMNKMVFASYVDTGSMPLK